MGKTTQTMVFIIFIFNIVLTFLSFKMLLSLRVFLVWQADIYFHTLAQSPELVQNIFLYAEVKRSKVENT